MAPHSVLLPGKSHGRRTLVGCSPWGRKELDTTERLPFPFSLSCIGEGNGNPLQCSCLENPRDGGAWWATVQGVAESDMTEHSTAQMYIYQFSSVAQSCPTLCDPMNCSTPGIPDHHQLPEFTQTHIH